MTMICSYKIMQKLLENSHKYLWILNFVLMLFVLPVNIPNNSLDFVFSSSGSTAFGSSHWHYGNHWYTICFSNKWWIVSNIWWIHEIFAGKNILKIKDHEIFRQNKRLTIFFIFINSATRCFENRGCYITEWLPEKAKWTLL